MRTHVPATTHISLLALLALSAGCSDMVGGWFGVPETATITVTAPAGAESWYVGEAHSVTWTSTDVTGTVDVEYSADGGATWAVVASGEADDGTYDWTITQETSATAMIRVIATDRSALGTCNAAFAVLYNGPVWYVDIDAPADGDGSSWAKAFRLPNEAVTAASSGHEIWVAEGTYWPSSVDLGGGPIDVPLGIRNGVSVYGGFGGIGTDETSRAQRNPDANLTTLDAEDMDTCAVMGGSNATLDGFTITRGNNSTHGGGMLNDAVSDLTVSNCAFLANASAQSGAAMYNIDSTGLVVRDCTFTSSAANDDGGAIYNGSSTVLVSNCVMTGNSATQGGAIANIYSLGEVYRATITGCRFESNSAASGGGVYGANHHVPLTNCVFFNNTATDGSAGHTTSDNADPAVYVNCTFYGNSNTALIANESNIAVVNCILWGGGSADLEVVGAGTLDVSFTCIDQASGYTDGGGNLVSTDPTFVDPGSGDLHLQSQAPASPCIDAGRSTGAPETDIAGELRPRAGGVDMGAYEAPPEGVRYVDGSVAASGNGSSWAQAKKTIQELNPGDGYEAWVAAGTYTYPGEAVLLTMHPHVGYYGGFAGGETTRSDRDVTANRAILDGDLTATHVVVGASHTVLDGFTITRGLAQSGGADDDGAGMINSLVTGVTVRRCVFVSNTAQRNGGAMSNNACTGPVEVMDTVFANCSTSGDGGAIHNTGSSVSLSNCTFYSNTAITSGGACALVSSSDTNITNCLFWENDAPSDPNIYDDASGTRLVSHSLLQYGYTGTSIYDAYPLFVDMADPDGLDNLWGTADDGLALLYGSPAIDGGLQDAGGATDILGQMRHDDPGVTNVATNTDSHPDVGAYEFQGDSTAAYKIVTIVGATIATRGTVRDLETSTDYLTSKIVLRQMRAGSFMMGDEDGTGTADDLPAHPVTITEDYYMGVFELTQEQWASGWWPDNADSFSGTHLPSEFVSWSEIRTVCEELTTASGQTFRIPTEAEWEYACKAGTHTTYSYGDAYDGEWAWDNSNSGGVTHVVATTPRRPNPWGLYDMYGNVWEICHDRYDPDYYQYCVDNAVTDDPLGSTSGEGTRRGGSFSSGASSDSRQEFVRSAASGNTGIRIVMDPTPHPMVLVTIPGGGETYASGVAHVIEWNSFCIGRTVDIEWSDDSGATWSTISSNESDDGYYQGTAPSADSTACVIRVSATDGTASDASQEFTITP